MPSIFISRVALLGKDIFPLRTGEKDQISNPFFSGIYPAFTSGS